MHSTLGPPCAATSCAQRSSSLLLLQADAWHTAMKHSRQAMEALAGGGGGGGGADANLEDWDAMSVASSEGAAPASGAAAAGQKPTLEVRASLGEFAIFVSGRVCDDWWPSSGETVRSHTRVPHCRE